LGHGQERADCLHGRHHTGHVEKTWQAGAEQHGPPRREFAALASVYRVGWTVDFPHDRK
jgi:hypothetical protein